MRIEGAPQALAGAVEPAREQGGFQSVFQQQLAGLRVSAHAAERLRAAGAGERELAVAAAAVDRAAAHGSRSTLVITANLAMVVSVPNRTVVTAVEAARMRDHVFTAIDSAVFA